VRKVLSTEIERGQVTVRIVLQQDDASGKLLQTQATQLKSLKHSWDQMAQELGLDRSCVNLRFLVDQLQSASSLTSSEEEGSCKAAIESTLKDALKEFMAMKLQEGKALKLEIVKRLEAIAEAVKHAEARKEAPLLKYRQKITERLQEVSELSPELEERVAREVALMAEKMDVTEEVVRLYSHLEQFRAHLETREKSIGRTLDFLVQEMNREMNTLSSKSADTEVSSLVVRMKSELEKIREQVQNIE
jgi:uncharacterized protein (TIGR00255 family)